MNSRVEPEVICAPLSETAKSTGRRSARSPDGSSVSARISSSSPSRSSALVNTAWTWTWVASGHSIVSTPLARDEVEDRQRARARGGKGAEVITPDLARAVVDPLRPGPGLGPGPGRPVGQRSAVREQHPQHGRRRDPHASEVGAAVRELAMRAIDLAPLRRELEDRADLLRPERVHRPPARPAILQRAGGLARLPVARASLREPQHAARAPEAPTGARGLGDQPQQRRLDVGVDASGDRAYQPERVFPAAPRVRSPAP